MSTPSDPITPIKSSGPDESDEETRRAPDPYAPMRVPGYRRFLIGGVCSATGAQMLNLAVGWELYGRTHSKLVLAYVGLALVLPIFLFSLPAGHVADRFDRRWVCAGALSLRVLSSLALLWISYTQAPIVGVYACLFVNGAMRAFRAPARTALLPEILPMDHFEHAVRWNTGGFQLASVCPHCAGRSCSNWARFKRSQKIVNGPRFLAWMRPDRKSVPCTSGQACPEWHTHRAY